MIIDITNFKHRDKFDHLVDVFKEEVAATYIDIKNFSDHYENNVVKTYIENNIEKTIQFRRDYYLYKFIYMLQFIHMYLSYKIDTPILYTSIIVPAIFTSYISKYTNIIPKIIEIYLMFDMINNIDLRYLEYIYIYINIMFNWIQLCKPIYL